MNEFDDKNLFLSRLVEQSRKDLKKTITTAFTILVILNAVFFLALYKWLS